MIFFDWQTADRKSAADRVSDILRRTGTTVLVPTETVYGLIGRAADPECRQRIVSLKHRDPAKHIGWFVRDISQLKALGYRFSDAALELAERFMPGAITLIVKKDDNSTVGFRIPDHPLLLEILEQLGEPLCQTSANRSGMPDALSCREALDMLCGEPDAAVDGGAIPPGSMGSTIVDCTGEKPVIIRQGALNIDNFLSSL